MKKLLDIPEETVKFYKSMKIRRRQSVKSMMEKAIIDYQAATPEFYDGKQAIGYLDEYGGLPPTTGKKNKK